MKILKHGCTYKNHKVLICNNCGLTAVIDDEKLKSNSINCPECLEENIISFMDDDEHKELKREIKEEE